MLSLSIKLCFNRIILHYLGSRQILWCSKDKQIKLMFVWFVILSHSFLQLTNDTVEGNETTIVNDLQHVRERSGGHDQKDRKYGQDTKPTAKIARFEIEANAS